MTQNLRKIFPAFLALLLLSGVLGAADQVRIREDAPAQYEVVKGDTLWDISGRFLEDPWLWPEVWELNPQIENPHLIYPGDVIELQYSADGPMLTLRRAGEIANPGGLRTVKLSPQVRIEPLDNAIPAIPLDRISAVLSGNIVIPQGEAENMPYLLGNRSGNLFTSTYDEVFGRGTWSGNVKQYDIVRPGRQYLDPASGEVLGIEGRLIGTASMKEQTGDTATLLVDSLIEEARAGDRFVPTAGNRIDANYFPQPPAFNIEAKILDIVAGRKIGSLYDSIVINKGESDGLSDGDLLALQKPDTAVEDNIAEATAGQKFRKALGTETSHIIYFDGEIYGSVLIYRVFENASLGIILDADEIVRLEDHLVTP